MVSKGQVKGEKRKSEEEVKGSWKVKKEKGDQVMGLKRKKRKKESNGTCK